MEVIVEQLGTTNNVLDRQKFDAHTIWLGRAFENDVILADEHVDARHARLTFDPEGRLWLEDLDSVNGIRRPRHKAHIERTEVKSGEIFLIGRSRVRIYLGTHPVAPAVRIRLSEVFLLWLGKPQVAVMLALVFVAAKVLGTWLSTIGEFRWSQVIERNLGEVLTFLALAVGVYFLSVLFRRGGNFLAHLSLLILVFLLSSLLEFALNVGLFNAGDRWYPTLERLDAARGYLMLFVYLWSILYLAFHIPLMRRTLVSAVIVAVIAGVSNLPEDDSVRRFVDPQTFPLKQKWFPPSLLMVRPQRAPKFEDSLQEVLKTLEDKRNEALDERDEDEGETAEGAAAPKTPVPESSPEAGPDDASGEEDESIAGRGSAAPGAEQPIE
ncbi:MAG: FHA domain-containing protein [Wenzhouxiangellaceae bacterium]|nr:FHA domain-containing protein [Wenzhouxiangellaceae bacterium]